MAKLQLLGALGCAVTFIALGAPEAESATPVSTDFSQRPHASGVHDSFPWPQRSAFLRRFEAPAVARSFRLVRGRFAHAYDDELATMDDEAAQRWLSRRVKAGELVAQDVVLVIERDRVWPLMTLTRTDDEVRSWLFRDVAAEAFSRAERGRVITRHHGRAAWRFDVTDVISDRPAQAAAVADWSYTTTLLEREGALYDLRNEGARGEAGFTAASFDEAELRGPEEALALVRALLDAPPSSSSPLLPRAAALAAKHGDLALALKLRALYRPVGRCSVDTRPQEAAAEYQDLCFEARDLGCFLQLQVKIMGQQFARVAYSSYGDEAHASYVERIAMTGTDPLSFLLGLLIQLEGGEEPPAEIDSWRLARAFVDGGFGAPGEAALLARAEDASLDPYNRLRATLVLAFSRIQAARASAPRDEAPARRSLVDDLAGRRLHPWAREWLETL